MKTVTNFKYINRNKKIANYTQIVSLVILVGGFVISLNMTDANSLLYSTLALVLGFILFQVSVYFSNHWGRSPRPDEKLAAGLKGLEDKYTFYDYVTVVPQLLVGPAGIWILVPYWQKGSFSYDSTKKRWRQKGGNFLLKLIGQENLGRPEQDTYNMFQDLQKYISKEVEIPNLPSPQVAMVFLDENAVIEAEDSPIPALRIDKLKDFMRRQAKENIVKNDSKDNGAVDPIRKFQQLLPEESDSV